MADALLSIALEKLSNVLGQQLSLFAGATDELQKLKDTFQSIQALLADAESRQVADESVNLWLSRLRGVAYDIDDLLDDWVISGLEEDGTDDDDDENKVSACLLSPCISLDHVASRYKIACRIAHVRERLDQIDGDKNKYCFSSLGGDRALVSRRPQTGSLIEEEMMGRDKDKNEILSSLVSGSSSEDGQVRVIAVVGIGGQGKTTLAREIYNDSSLQEHFNLFSWVCVTEIFDVARLTKSILDDLKVQTYTYDLNPLQKELREQLEGKRFLLVLDDVWNEDEERWNAFRASVTSGAAGSRILVTTRTQKVANTMKAVSIHELEGLSEDDSWRLFSRRAFAGRNGEECFELEAVGRQIVSKCKGVPLSIKVIGSAMNCKRTAEDWQNILHSKMWTLPEAKNKILPALWLSYYNLPPPLKQCFAYCSVYEKDTVIQKERLIKLWVAQGFVPSQGNREVEDIGAEYFDGLVAWSMFQEVKEGYRWTTCKMHDLLHDLAELITKNETCIYKNEQSNGCHTNIRHASLFLSENNPAFNPIASGGSKTLRTLFLNGVVKFDTMLVDLFREARYLRALQFLGPEIKRLPKSIGKLKHLRYLDLSYSWIVELPNVIGKMKHLKYLNLCDSELLELPHAIGKLKHLTYLNLSYSNIEELPESVSHLHNLHTLNLNHCFNLKKLPRGLGGMVRLRHLQIEGTGSLRHLPGGLGRMTALKSLCKFIVGGEGGCGINELQHLNCLQGSLKVKNLERVLSREEARKAELLNKPHLHRLILEMSEREEEIVMSGREAEIERMNSVLEVLRPHVDLAELKLKCNRRSSKLPSWMEDSSFSKLTKLEIVGFIIPCEQNNLPGLGKLPALKYLKIWDVGVEKVGHELCYGNSSNDVIGGGRRVAFPKLEQLVLGAMAELEEWELTSEADADVMIMPSLRILRLENCPKLEGLPHQLANSALKKAIIRDCHRIKGTGCSSFSLLEEFTLYGDNEFFSNGLPLLPNLKEFGIERIRTETLPAEGWELLVALRQLEIEDCIELKSLPDGLTQLQSLENLKIQGCHKLESLPEGLGQLKKLQSLRIGGLEALTCLPDSLGQSESLENLDILDVKNLQLLPEGLGQLKKLKSLKISNAEALTCLPNSLAQLGSLEHLDIGGLKKLESLPEGLGQLEKLKSLKIRGVEVLTCLPDSLGQLESLEDLDLNCPKNLELLPEGLGQLKKLKLLKLSGAEALTSLPDSLAQLESLEDLDINCLKKLELLPEGLGQLKKLKLLKLSGAEALTSLPDSLAQLESLKHFEIIGWAKLESLPHWLGQLKKLESLVIENMEALTCLPDSVGQLESLKSLNISHCKKLKSLPRQLGQLESLEINHLEALTCLPDMLAQLSSLRYLTIGGLKELESLPHWLGQLKALRRLMLSDCEALRSLPYGLRDLPLLRQLWINGCPLLSERCKKEGGQDWPKISDIPQIEIDGRSI